MQPVYTPQNTSTAWQLNWSVSIFGRSELPSVERWLDDLRSVTELDGVRILEHHTSEPNVAQFLVSTCPVSAPSQIVRALKGRWQYLFRQCTPHMFRRNYSIKSIGETNNSVLERYVGMQTKIHRMADQRVQRQIESLQFNDPNVKLCQERFGTYGCSLYNLHVVLENTGGWHEIRPAVLSRSRQVVIQSAARHSWQLARIGILSNHIHILLIANVTDSPESVALSLMNNLAWAQQMQPVLRFSYYVGTFGSYDRGAIRNKLRGN